MPESRSNQCAAARLPARAAAAAVMALVLAGPAQGLINVNYSPVDLVRQSEVILRLQVGPLSDAEPLPANVLKALQGDVPEGLALQVAVRNADVTEGLRKAFGGRKTAPALVFLGDFSGASQSGEEAGDDNPVGFLRVDRSWFGLYPKGGATFEVGPDPFYMMAVWDGGDAMLERVVEYVAGDWAADVPVRVGVTWAACDRAATLQGPAAGCLAVDLQGTGAKALLVLSETGDRLFECGQDGRTADTTDRRGLDTASRAAAVGDFSGDGRLDLASWDGQALVFRHMTEDGTFVKGGPSIALEGGCLALAAVETGAGRAALVASTARGPALVALGDDATPAVTPLPAGEGSADAEAGPCAVADFDGDGLVDVLHAMARRLLLYRGMGPGAFAAPVEAAGVGLGSAPGSVDCGDWDADGRLDVLVAGNQGALLFANAGDGRFDEVFDESGEPVYLSKDKVVAAAGCDVNNDGRHDFFLLYANLPPQLYFSRGFRCFGLGLELKVEESGLEVSALSTRGQQTGVVADFNGDGAQDLALVTVDGNLWLVRREADEGPTFGVQVALAPGRTGPVQVAAWDGGRPLGARVVRAGAPAFFGKLDKGPMDLQWRGPDRTPVRRRVIVLGPTRFLLPTSSGADAK